MTLNFFLFAAGEGKRTQPLSIYKPKPLFPIGNKPVIKILLNQLPENLIGFVNTFYKAELIEKELKNERKIKIIREKKLTGNLVLKTTINHDYEYLLILNSDVLINIPFSLINKSYDKNEVTLFLKESNSNKYNKLLIKNNRITDIKRFQKGYFYTGLAIISKDIVKILDNENIIKFIKEKSIKVNFIEYNDYWFDIGSPELYYNSVFNYFKINNILESNSISKDVKIKESLISNSIIWENTKITNSSIKNCIILNNLIIENKNYNNKIITKDKIYNL